MRYGVVTVNEAAHSLGGASAVLVASEECVEDVPWLIYHTHVRRITGPALTVGRS